MRNGVQRGNIVKRVYHRVLLLPPTHSTLAFGTLANRGCAAVLAVLPFCRMRGSRGPAFILFFHFAAFFLRTLFNLGKRLHDGLQRKHSSERRLVHGACEKTEATRRT
jgi:hypothetical protein